MNGYRDVRLGELIAHIETLDGYTVTASSVNDASGTRRTLTLRIDDAYTIGGVASPPPLTVSPPALAPSPSSPRYAVVARVHELAGLVALHLPGGADAWSTWRAASPRWWASMNELDRAEHYLIGLLANVGIAPDGSDLPNPDTHADEPGKAS